MTTPSNPSHYKTGDIECIDAIRSALGPERFEGFLQGNVIKYTWRYKTKVVPKTLRRQRFIWVGYLTRLRLRSDEVAPSHS